MSKLAITAFLVSASQFVLVPPAFSQTIDVAADTMTVCGNNTELSDRLRSSLTLVGWSPLQDSDADSFVRTIADGIMIAMSGPQDKQIDWVRAEMRAGEMAEQLLDTYISGGPVELFSRNENGFSVLATFSQSAGSSNMLQCIYSGSPSQSVTDRMDGIAQNDAAAGVEQANDGVQIVNFRDTPQEGQQDEIPRTVYVKAARFLGDSVGSLNRPKNSTLGFSVRTITRNQ